MAELEIAPGSVWLVGAGPGDPDLLSRKAEKLILAASIVFHDALIGCGVLGLIPAGTRRVAVGKRAGRHSASQDAINRLLVDAALAGERVVRLKGGDPSVFGRSSEEVEALRGHGIPVSICPGITAAAAAAASAGVSLTRRGDARQLIFVTGHAREGDSLDLDWDLLGASRATIAIYMGKGAAAQIARKLIRAGRPAATPVLIVENASLAGEQQLSTRLDLLGFGAATIAGDGPMILIVGDSVAPAGPPLPRSTAAFVGERESHIG
jgi:uroporphyrin-III C-methyltransferase